MMESVVPSALICIAYFIFVWLSPGIMKNRQAVEMRPVLLVYNLAMVALSGYIFFEVSTAISGI